MFQDVLRLDENALMNPTHGPILQKLLAAIGVGREKEHREQFAKDFWKSLTEQELDIVADDDESTVVITIALKSLFYSENPDDLECEITSDEEFNRDFINTSIVASFEILLRKGEILSNGGYFYNPFALEGNTMFAPAHRPDLLDESDIDKLNKLL